jgi:hypothetical protein
MRTFAHRSLSTLPLDPRRRGEAGARHRVAWSVVEERIQGCRRGAGARCERDGLTLRGSAAGA